VKDVEYQLESVENLDALRWEFVNRGDTYVWLKMH